MLRIDHTAVRGADIGGKTIRPAAISAVCPKCNEKGVFSLGNFSPVGPQNSISADGICPSCKFKVGFWSVNPRGASNIEEAEIYMCPAPKLYSPIQGDLTGVPEPLRRSLLSTIECYNAGIYPATTVSGRRTLEGIFKYLVSEDKRKLNLAKLIDAAIADNDLSAPLSKLSHAIRSGGNLGAHFDMEHEPDENVARQIVELLSYLISYLYILPAKINQLENALEKPSNNTIAEG